MKKVILYGIGKYYQKHSNEIPQEIEIVAYGDSNEEKTTSKSGNLLNGKRILSPKEIEKGIVSITEPDCAL